MRLLKAFGLITAAIIISACATASGNQIPELISPSR